MAVDEAVKRLTAAKRTVIYCGGGAVSSAAPNAIASIAEALNAPVIASIQGKGAIPADHPNFAGSAWGAGNALDDLIKQADCMLIFGSRMGAQATQDFKMSFPREVIRIDIDPVELTLNLNPTLAIQADSAAAATAIAASSRTRARRGRVRQPANRRGAGKCPKLIPTTRSGANGRTLFGRPSGATESWSPI